MLIGNIFENDMSELRKQLETKTKNKSSPSIKDQIVLEKGVTIAYAKTLALYYKQQGYSLHETKEKVTSYLNKVIEEHNIGDPNLINEVMNYIFELYKQPNYKTTFTQELQNFLKKQNIDPNNEFVEKTLKTIDGLDSNFRLFK